MPGPTLGRRRLLGYVGSAVAGAAVASPATAALVRDREPHQAAAAAGTVLSPYGVHQPGVSAPPARHTTLVALDLLPSTDADALVRLLKVWTTDVVALTEGRPVPGDVAPELAEPAGLTLTVGLGAGAFIGRLADRRPIGLAQIPAMQHDRLEERWSGGDLCVLIAGEDVTTVEHAVRCLVRDARPFASVRWRQSGGWRGTDRHGAAVTGRNHFGQVDGTSNPRPGTKLHDDTVWIADGAWAGGTTLVVRRIRMDMTTWDVLTRFEQERSMGRDLPSGAPLTGGTEFDDVDLRAEDEHGKLIASDAHVRRSHPDLNAGKRIFRKGVNYVDGEEYGLLFLSFQADVADQFVPIQQSLDTADALNAWTTAIGSAGFAVLPGIHEGDWLGRIVLE